MAFHLLGTLAPQRFYCSEGGIGDVQSRRVIHLPSYRNEYFIFKIVLAETAIPGGWMESDAGVALTPSQDPEVGRRMKLYLCRLTGARTATLSSTRSTDD